MTLSEGRALDVQIFLCGFKPIIRMTRRRGVGGEGSGVRLGSGDGVREREKILERLGKSALEGRVSDECEAEAAVGGEGGGAAQSAMTDADSARSVSPIL